MELTIQTYLKKNGLDETIKTFDLKIRDYGHKILLKYNQLSPPTLMANPGYKSVVG
jgi:hypothetical protein